MSVFVGRERELGVLSRCFEGLDGPMGPREVWIEGETGIGKTALLKRFESAHPHATVLRAEHCEEAWRPPFDTLGAMLIQLETQLGSSRFESMLTRPARLAPLVPELASGETAEDPQLPELADELARMLMLAAQRAPLLVIIDDWHLADDASSRLVRMVLPLVKHERMLFAFACDSASLPRAGWDRSVQMELRGLSTDELSEFVTVVAGEPADPQWVQALADYTRGNPMLVSSLLRVAIRGSVMKQPAELSLPIDVAIHTLKRLRRLRPSARQLVLGAAVLPRNSPVERAIEVGGVIGDPSSALEEAKASRLLDVSRNGERVSPPAPLIGRSVLDSLSPRRRRQLLQRAHLSLRSR